MEKVFIFGCGNLGKFLYDQLHNVINIIGYIDNNQEKWGTDYNGINIFSPNEAFNIAKEQDIYIIFGIVEYEDVLKQVLNEGIRKIVIWKQGFLFSYSEGSQLMPISLIDLVPYKKLNKNNLSVLFLQDKACIRTLKIANAVKKLGADVSLAYTLSPPEQKNYIGIFDNIYAISNMKDFSDFLNKSEFDIIHSSNEPDFLTVLAHSGNIPVVHDCHDLSSGYLNLKINDLILEYAANSNSNGVIYYSEHIRNKALSEFAVSADKTFVLENLISEELKPSKYLKKLSESDGKIHIVYEGGVINDKKSHRYFEKIWNSIASDRIELHFYAPGDTKYFHYLETINPHIHYEGNFSSKDLSTEMTKYDVGLIYLNVTDENRDYLESCFPNKIQEYINAGLPVAVGDIQSQIDFVESNSFGKYLDLDSDILSQLKEIAEIPIEHGILTKKGYTLESKIPALVDFYKKVIDTYKKRLD